MHSKITVLIPTFNRAQYLKSCLDSILNQTLPASEIIVVNDGSTDNTLNILEPYMKRIKYLESNQLGKPGAINRGLDEETRDYIWIFDDDDVALPDALERLVEPLENHPEYDFSYSSFFYTANGKDHQLGPILRELKIPNLQERGFLIPLLEFNFLGGAALFTRTSCYKEVGNFDPELLRSQDYEMAIRIARRFKGIQVSGGPTFHYRQHEGHRGPVKDRFAVKKINNKWSEYGRKFFQKLYTEIPLAEYLPPGYFLDHNTRQALLQRMAIMCYRKLVPQVISDLHELAKLTNQTPFSKEEYSIVRDIMIPAFNHNAPIFNYLEFFDNIHLLSTSSPVMRLLRANVFRSLLARGKSNFNLKEILKITHRCLRLYFIKIDS